MRRSKPRTVANGAPIAGPGRIIGAGPTPIDPNIDGDAPPAAAPASCGGIAPESPACIDGPGGPSRLVAITARSGVRKRGSGALGSTGASPVSSRASEPGRGGGRGGGTDCVLFVVRTRRSGGTVASGRRCGGIVGGDSRRSGGTVACWRARLSGFTVSPVVRPGRPFTVASSSSSSRWPQPAIGTSTLASPSALAG